MTVHIRQTSPEAPEANALIHAYMRDVATRWYGRPAENDEAAQALLEELSEGLDEPDGYFAVAYSTTSPVGTGGLRFIGKRIAELTKVFTLQSARAQAHPFQLGSARSLLLGSLGLVTPLRPFHTGSRAKIGRLGRYAHYFDQ